MKDELNIAIVSKLKHGDLVKAILERGWTQNDAANYFGMSASTFGRLINLKWIPKRFSEEFTVKLLELTGKLPEDLFPESFRQPEFLKMDKTSVVYAQANPALASALLPKQIVAGDPEELYDKLELRETLEELFETLDSKQSQVLRMLYLEKMDASEVAQALNTTQSKVHQIESRALRHMRHPARSSRLKDFAP